jgi:hypothetical protein
MLDVIWQRAEDQWDTISETSLSGAGDSTDGVEHAWQ